jgi:ABC-type amino acid transport substrate-binding protein
MNELLKGIINNKVDFIIGDFNTILFIANKNNYNDKIRFLPSSIKKVPRYIAFSKKSKHKALYFDIKLKEIINSKEYNDIIEKYENIFKNRR